MSEIPQDWNDSKKLWDIMGKTPAKKPSAEFNQVVKQKTSLYGRMPGFKNRVERKAAQIAESRRLRERSVPSKSTSVVPIWTIFIVVGVVSLVLTWAGLQSVPSRSSLQKASSSSSPIGFEVPSETFEMAKHYELIRNMDMIERLDEVKP